MPGGRLTPIAGTGRLLYRARSSSRRRGAASPIHSEYRSQSIEANDTIRWKNWTFNVGLLASNDTLYGQGLREDTSTLSGFVARARERSTRCTRSRSARCCSRVLGATWAYNGSDTIFASYATYNPAASSLPRAASWDRNLDRHVINADFDANGVLFATMPVGSSSGKLFVAGPDAARRSTSCSSARRGS